MFVVQSFNISKRLGVVEIADESATCDLGLQL